MEKSGIVNSVSKCMHDRWEALVEASYDSA